MNPRTELLSKIAKETEEYIKSKDKLKNDIAQRKMGQMAIIQNTNTLFAPLTQKANEESKVFESIKDELKQEIKESKTPQITSSDKEVRLPNEDIEIVISQFSKIPLQKKSTVVSSNSTTMKVSGALADGSPVYTLNGKYFNIHNDKLLEINKENGEITKMHKINPNIAEVFFNPNPLEKQYSKPELGQFLRILQTTGKSLDNSGEKMRSVLSQLELYSKPKLKDLPQGTGVKFLPSDPKMLFERLFILLGSQKAGNNDIRNEAISIMDNLLERKIFNKEQYRNLYEEYFK